MNPHRMHSRFSRSLLLLLLVATVANAGDDGKKCGASARECEQQIRQMLAGRRYVGVQIEELNPGVAIKTIAPDSPASRVDLKEGDRIIALNGRWMTQATIRDFKQMIAELKDKGKLTMIIQRRGTYRKVDVQPEPYSKAQIDKIVAAHLAQSHTDVASQP